MELVEADDDLPTSFNDWYEMGDADAGGVDLQILLNSLFTAAGFEDRDTAGLREVLGVMMTGAHHCGMIDQGIIQRQMAV